MSFFKWEQFQRKENVNVLHIYGGYSHHRSQPIKPRHIQDGWDGDGGLSDGFHVFTLGDCRR